MEVAGDEAAVEFAEGTGGRRATEVGALDCRPTPRPRVSETPGKRRLEKSLGGGGQCRPSSDGRWSRAAGQRTEVIFFEAAPAGARHGCFRRPRALPEGCAGACSGKCSRGAPSFASSASTSPPRRREAAAATHTIDGRAVIETWFCVQLSTQNGSHTRASAAMHAPVHREKLAGLRIVARDRAVGGRRLEAAALAADQAAREVRRRVRQRRRRRHEARLDEALEAARHARRLVLVGLLHVRHAVVVEAALVVHRPYSARRTPGRRRTSPAHSVTLKYRCSRGQPSGAPSTSTEPLPRVVARAARRVGHVVRVVEQTTVPLGPRIVLLAMQVHQLRDRARRVEALVGSSRRPGTAAC